MTSPNDGGSNTMAATSSPFRLLNAKHAALFVLVLISLFNYIDRQVLAAVVPALREVLFPGGQVEHFWLTDILVSFLQMFLGKNPENALIGLLSMAFMVTYTVFSPLFARLSIRRWWVIGGALAVWSLASGASGLATTFGILLLTRCLVGIGEAAYGPIAPSVIADSYPLKERNWAISIFYLTIPVGCALGFAFGGYMAGTALGWRWAFFLPVLPGLVLAVLAFYMPDPKEKTDDGHTVKTSMWREYITFLKNRSYLFDVLGITSLTFAIGGVGFWMPSYMYEVRHAGTLAEVNIIFGVILVLSGLLGTLLGGWAGDKLQSRHPGAYFIVSGLAMFLAFPTIIASLYAPFPLAWGLLFIACLCLFFNTGPTNAIIANVVTSRQRASAFALSILFSHALGDVISPLVIGAVSDATGSMTIAFLVVSVVVLFGGVFWMMGAPFLARDTAAAAAADQAEAAASAKKSDDGATKDTATKGDSAGASQNSDSPGNNVTEGQSGKDTDSKETK